MTYTYKPSGNITINAGATVGGIAGSGMSTITLSNTSATSWPLGSGGAGQIYTTTGTNGASWVTPNTTLSNNNGKALMTIPHGEDKIILDEKATLEVKGNVKINGVDLEERLRTIEKVLQIPERDAKLEAKYPKLKKMYDDYINALGKYRTFESIKGEE